MREDQIGVEIVCANSLRGVCLVFQPFPFFCFNTNFHAQTCKPKTIYSNISLSLSTQRERSNSLQELNEENVLQLHCLMRTSSFGRCSSSEFQLPESFATSSPATGGRAYGAMMPVFLNDLRSNHHKELVEITLELENDAVVLCNLTPAAAYSAPNASPSSSSGGGDGGGGVARSLSITSRIRRKFPWLRSLSSASVESVAAAEDPVTMARNARKMRAKLERTRSSAQRALKGLRFISKSGEASEELWGKVQERFSVLAKDGLLAREDFGECIGN